jgi:hypothetical protein
MNNNDGHFENDLACAYISKHHQLLVTMSTKAILENKKLAFLNITFCQIYMRFV